VTWASGGGDVARVASPRGCGRIEDDLLSTR